MLSKRISLFIGFSGLNPIQNALFKAMENALVRYSNVSRGTGAHSLATTKLLLAATQYFGNHAGLQGKPNIIVGDEAYIDMLKAMFAPFLKDENKNCNWRSISTRIKVYKASQLNLPLDVGVMVLDDDQARAIVVRVTRPLRPGGGTVKWVDPTRAIWVEGVDRFVPGTPNIQGVIAFAVAHRLSALSDHHKTALGRKSRQTLRQIFSDQLPNAGDHLLQALRGLLIGYRTKVPTQTWDHWLDEKAAPFIHFDNAASTPTFKPIWNVAKRVMSLPEGQYPGVIRKSTQIILNFLNASKHAVVFVSNTTTGINMVADLLKSGFLRENDEDEISVVSTLLEHNSNELPWRFLNNVRHLHLDVNRKGFMSPDKLRRLLQRAKDKSHPVRLVTLSGASNVLGTVNDLKPLIKIAHQFEAMVLVDGAQLVPHQAVDLTQLDADFLVFSGHKIYAPFGSGAVIIHPRVMAKIKGKALATLKHYRQAALRNVVGIATMAKSMELLQRIGMTVLQTQEIALTLTMINGLKKIPKLKLYGPTRASDIKEGRRIGVVTFGLKTLDQEYLAEMLAMKGVGSRYGCFCTHDLVFKKMFPAYHELVAKALEDSNGLVRNRQILPDNIERPNMVRLSLGLQNTRSEVNRVVRTVVELTKLRRFIDISRYPVLVRETVANPLIRSICLGRD